jgi:hypothetical protein
MIRRQLSHLEPDLLSAYLDREVGLVEARAVEAHLSSCEPCRRRLAGMERVVGGLGSVARQAPPPWLAQQVRAVVASQPPPFWQRLGRALLQLPLQSPIGGTLSATVALACVLYMVTAGLDHGSRRGLPGIASYPGPVTFPTDDPNWILRRTTSVVAGRTFVLREDDDVWVEKGLSGLRSERINVASPEGRALLARFSDLGYLLADGSRVMIRYQRETLELWSGT